MDTKFFWGQLAPSQHLVQVYQDEGIFEKSLEHFVMTGLENGETIVVIATPEHQMSLEARLRARSFNLEHILATDQLIRMDAAESMNRLLLNRSIDFKRFENWAHTLLKRARKTNRPIRAFGEIVALMWAEGFSEAALQLEQSWHKLCHKEEFALFCAYPKNEFTQNAEEAIRKISATHSHTLPGECAICA